MLGVLVASMQLAYGLLLVVGLVRAVDRSKFKTCEQSKFCQ